MPTMTTEEALAALGALAGTLRSARARAEAIAEAIEPADLEALLDEEDRACTSTQGRLDLDAWHAARRVVEAEGRLEDLVEGLDEFLAAPSGPAGAAP
jgi:hypothetical protein